MKQSSKKLDWIFNRWLIAYLVIGMFLFCFVERTQIKLKTLNHLRNSARILNKSAIKGLKVEEEVLYESIQYSKRLPLYNPGLKMAYSVLGYSYYHIGDLKRAIKEYQKAVEVYPDLYGMHFNLGMLLVFDKQWQKGVDVLRASELISPDKSVVYHKRVAARMFEDESYAGLWLMDKINNLKLSHKTAAEIIATYDKYRDEPEKLREQLNLAKDYVKLYYYVPLYEVGIIPLEDINDENVNYFQ